MDKTDERPSQTFAGIIKKARLVSAVVGADIVSKDYRVNWVTFVVISCISIYFIFTVTTVASVFAENWTYMLEASCMLGSVLQGITKLLTGIVFTKGLCGVRVQLEQLYLDYETRGEQYVLALKESCVRLSGVIRLVGTIYLLSTFGIVFLTLGMVAVTGNRYLIMHFLIPGVDVGTYFGYVVTMGVHCVVIMAGGFGLFAGDLFVLIFLDQAITFVDIFKVKVMELNELSENCESHTRALINDIIEWHQFYTEYNETCNNYFYYINSMQVATSGISILCSLYVVLMGDWPGVYLYITVAFCGLYLYCIMGTKIETCNDTICDEIYNINWYNISAVERKMLLLTLMKSQNPSNIKVGGVFPLSVATALSITKTLYGIFTMMLQMLMDE